jgi:hypothetical protein
MKYNRSPPLSGESKSAAHPDYIIMLKRKGVAIEIESKMPRQVLHS